jgi:hypothetical protein
MIWCIKLGSQVEKYLLVVVAVIGDYLEALEGLW